MSRRTFARQPQHRQATYSPSAIVLSAQAGIMPNHVAKAHAKLHPQPKQQQQMPPFTMSDISKIRPFNLVESRKLFKASLFSRAGVDDIGRLSYLK